MSAENLDSQVAKFIGDVSDFPDASEAVCGFFGVIDLDEIPPELVKAMTLLELAETLETTELSLLFGVTRPANWRTSNAVSTGLKRERALEVFDQLEDERSLVGIEHFRGAAWLQDPIRPINSFSRAFYDVHGQTDQYGRRIPSITAAHTRDIGEIPEGFASPSTPKHRHPFIGMQYPASDVLTYASEVASNISGYQKPSGAEEALQVVGAEVLKAIS